ncbi:MAG: sensor histidine kinase, partial [Minisyncoccota bacterium]
EDKQTTNEYVGMLYESSSSMLDLVNDLLDVSKLEAGKFEVDRQPINVKELLGERIKFYDTTARDASVAFNVSIGEGVPDTVLIDAKRIAQVMNNLLSNALKYTPKGGTVSVECFLHTQGVSIGDEAARSGMVWFSDNAEKNTAALPKSVVIAVTDTGEGIAPENMEKLWNKFTQFTSTARKGGDYKGTGLGLVIVKGIIEAHGGTVGVGSRLGSGSTFYFTLPL